MGPVVSRQPAGGQSAVRSAQSAVRSPQRAVFGRGFPLGQLALPGYRHGRDWKLTRLVRGRGQVEL